MQHPYEMDLKIPNIMDSLPNVISEINLLDIDNKMKKIEEHIVYSFNKRMYISNKQKRRKLTITTNLTSIVSNKRKFEEI